MNKRVLLVDDDLNILSAYRRQLRKQFDVETASGGEEGCEKLTAGEPFAVIISDMQMPGMNGVEFLKRATELSRDSVRLMLTGNADQGTATDAINEGSVFRFLTKPCPPSDLTQAIDDAVNQYRLITAEKELLEKTLRGSVQVMSEILSLVNPTAFGRASRIAELVRQLSEEIRVERPWELEMAAMLSQLGCVTIPESILAKSNSGEKLDENESRMFDAHPVVAANLLKNIPRLQRVATLIASQAHEIGDTTGDTELDVEMQMLRAAIDLEASTSKGMTAPVVLSELKASQSFGDEVLEALAAVVDRLPTSARELGVEQLTTGLVLAEAIESTSGQLLVAKGQKINESMLLRLRNFAGNMQIQEPLFVYDEAPHQLAV